MALGGRVDAGLAGKKVLKQTGLKLRLALWVKKSRPSPRIARSGIPTRLQLEAKVFTMQ